MIENLNIKKKKLIITASILLCGCLLGLALAKPNGASITILQTTQDLEINTLLKSEHVKMVKQPHNYVPPKYIQTKDQGLIIGQKVRSKLPQGTTLCWYHLAEPDWHQEGLASTIPSGKRAFSLNLSHQFGFHIMPGDLIDIIGFFRDPATGKEISKTILQRILVLKVKPSLIIEVGPHEIEQILFAQKKGSLHLSLRNQNDEAMIKTLPETEFYSFVGIHQKQRSQSITKNMPMYLQIPRKK